MSTPCIACLGWGSLIWNPDTLAQHLTGWNTDGPLLPLEFARTSKDGRLTLVLLEGAQPLPALWSEMVVTDIGAAAEALRKREGCLRERIGVWPGAAGQVAYSAIDGWARERGLDAVVWTALGPKFGANSVAPESADAAVNYLRLLKGDARGLAEEYVRKAPKQVSTRYRAAIEEALGWTFSPDFSPPRAT